VCVDHVALLHATGTFGAGAGEALVGKVLYQVGNPVRELLQEEDSLLHNWKIVA
jgi:hypothetical protein